MKSLINKITLNNIEYPYIIERKKIKNLYFRVKEDLCIHISANSFTSESYIRNILIENSDAIIKMYQKQKNKKQDTLTFLGEKLQFQKLTSKPYIEGNTIYGENETVCQDYLQKIAIDIFNQRLIALKSQFKDLPEFKLKTRKMTTKWGVCNHRSMTITLNTDLIAKDIHLIDYVIIHELCHFKHLDHSKAYWQYVSKFCPYYKQMRKELNY